MNAALLTLFATAAIGLDWQPMPDGSDGSAVTVQVSPEVAEALAAGHSVPISLEVPKEAGRVARINLEVVSGPQVRTSYKPPAEPLPEGVVETQYTVSPVSPTTTRTTPLLDAAQETGQRLGDVVRAGVEPIQEGLQMTRDRIRESASNLSGNNFQGNNPQGALGGYPNQPMAGGYQQPQQPTAQGYNAWTGSPTTQGNTYNGGMQNTQPGVDSGTIRQRLDRDIRPDEQVGSWNSTQFSTPPNNQPLGGQANDRYGSTANQAGNVAGGNTMGGTNMGTDPNGYNTAGSQPIGGNTSQGMNNNNFFGGSSADGFGYGQNSAPPQNHTQPQNTNPQLTRAGVEANGAAPPVEIPPASERFNTTQEQNQRTPQTVNRAPLDGPDTRTQPEAQQPLPQQQTPGQNGADPTPVFSLILAWVLLTGSVAGNLYLFTSYLDVRNKYRGIARDTPHVTHHYRAA